MGPRRGRKEQIVVGIMSGVWVGGKDEIRMIHEEKEKEKKKEEGENGAN